MKKDVAPKEQTLLISEIVQIRQNLGLSQRKLAEKAGIKQPVIARIEKGISSPQMDTLMKILTPLGYKLTITEAK